jgi:hypothetical protein
MTPWFCSSHISTLKIQSQTVFKPVRKTLELNEQASPFNSKIQKWNERLTLSVNVVAMVRSWSGL